MISAETAAVLLGVLSYTTLGYGLDRGHGESSGYVDYALVRLVQLWARLCVAVAGESPRSATFESLARLRELD